MAPKVHLLSGADVTEAMKSASGIELFRYQLNPMGWGIGMVLGGLFLAGAGLTWMLTALDSALWIALFAGLGGVGIAIAIQTAYWYAFAKTHFLACSDERLFVGKRGKAWSLAWSELDAEKMGFGKMQATKVGGALDIAVAGQQIHVHLYNPYAFLEDIQGFMFCVLQHIRDDADADAAAPAS